MKERHCREEDVLSRSWPFAQQSPFISALTSLQRRRRAVSIMALRSTKPVYIGVNVTAAKKTCCFDHGSSLDKARLYQRERHCREEDMLSRSWVFARQSPFISA